MGGCVKYHFNKVHFVMHGQSDSEESFSFGRAEHMEHLKSKTTLSASFSPSLSLIFISFSMPFCVPSASPRASNRHASRNKN